MIGLFDFEAGWLALVGLVALLLNSVVFVLATFHQRKKSSLLLRESQIELRGRLHRLEEDLALIRKQQSERWSEVRNTIARLEFRGGGASEHFQRPSILGLDKKHQVCSLARKGLAPAEIARKLNLYPGETELVLGLRKYGARTEINDARSSLQ